MEVSVSPFCAWSLLQFFFFIHLETKHENCKECDSPCKKWKQVTVSCTRFFKLLDRHLGLHDYWIWSVQFCALFPWKGEIGTIRTWQSCGNFSFAVLLSWQIDPIKSFDKPELRVSLSDQHSVTVLLPLIIPRS